MSVDVSQPLVEVLLATYNGERFLREQVESILLQEGVLVRILSRDDGSTDATPEILAEYATAMPERFRVLQGVPTGSAKANFLALMQYATAPYICFADQDDIWLPGKVRRGLESLAALEKEHGYSSPLLAFSDLRVVDETLKTVHESMWKYSHIDPNAACRLERLLGSAVVTGCTVMINRPLLELAKRMPQEATMHDRWIALLAAAMGKTIGIHEPLVLYRQHAANVIGAVTSDDSVAGILNRARHNEGRRVERRRCEQMVEALLAQHANEMSSKSATLLRAYVRSGQSANPVERVGLTLRYGFFRGRLLRNLALILDLVSAKSDEGISVAASQSGKHA